MTPMTVPTKLTISRLLLATVVMALLFVPGLVARAVALAVFVLASLTDWLDGYLARRWGQSTHLGALLDPIADKVLVIGVLLALVQLHVVPAWMVLIIILREFMITAVRLIAASRGVVLAAEAQGKQKAVSQMVTITLILGALTIVEASGGRPAPGVAAALQLAIDLALWITIVLTSISGVSFLWRHRGALAPR